nr:NACHT domain-containing protein [Anaerolineae bacterium]
RVGRALLILGGPGAGKTTMMLRLAKMLVARAETDPEEPVPVLFNLSSWGEQRLPLGRWLADELSEKYQIPRRIGAQWLDNGQLLLLLDGLDELPAGYQGDCVRAINTFREEHGLAPICITSRAQEYQLLDARLRLSGAVSLKPLTPEQVDRYLAESGPELTALRAALAEDTALQEMASTPLMLSVMVLVYHEAPVESLLALQTVEARRHHLFEAYIDRMFRRFKGATPFQREDTLRYTGWLADQMVRRAQAILLVEHLDDAWLESDAQRREKRTSQLVIATLIGLVAAAITGIVSSVQDALAFGWIFVLLVPLIVIPLNTIRNTIFYVLLMRQEYTTNLKRVVFRNGLVLIIAYGLTGAISTALIELAESGPDQLILSTLAGTVGSLIAIVLPLIFVIQCSRTTDTAEALSWSWKRALRGALLAAVVSTGVVAFAAASVVTLTFSSGERIADIDPLTQMTLATAFHLLLFFPIVVPQSILGLGMMFGISGRRIEQTTVPNQGVIQSRKNAVRMGLLFGVSMGVITLFFTGAAFIGTELFQAWGTGAAPDLPGALVRAVGNATSFGVLFLFSQALIYGGRTWIRHLTIRRVLARYGLIPHDLVGFLDYTADLVFLRRVGGGYIFAHRALMEHFAEKHGKQG